MCKNDSSALSLLLHLAICILSECNFNFTLHQKLKQLCIQAEGPSVGVLCRCTLYVPLIKYIFKQHASSPGIDFFFFKQGAIYNTTKCLIPSRPCYIFLLLKQLQRQQFILSVKRSFKPQVSYFFFLLIFSFLLTENKYD